MIRSQRNWIRPGIVMGDSPIHGRGMFAGRKIESGEVLVVWKEGYTDRAGAMEAVREGKGIMQWDEDVYSHETDRHSEEHSINHSCDPNSWMADAYTVVARRGIADGEEITVDMAMFMEDEEYVSSWVCNCGAASCRGKVTGKDWRSTELQERYRGHFSPLINKRIRAMRSGQGGQTT